MGDVPASRRASGAFTRGLFVAFLGTALGLSSLLPLPVTRAGGPSAAAEPGRPPQPVAAEVATVVVLPIAAAGTVHPDLDVAMTEQLLAGFQRAGYRAAAAEPAFVERWQGCADRVCRAEVARTLGSPFVVGTRVVVRERDYDVQLDLYRGDDGLVVASTRQDCEICGIQEAAEATGGGVATLARELSSLLRGTGTLLVTSSPSGAAVEVDGHAVGTTPYSGELPVGSRIVRVSRKGHISVEREVQVQGGLRARVTIALPTMSIAPGMAPGMRPYGIAALAVGALGMAGAAALFAFHGREPEGCRGQRPDADGDCKEVWDTLWWGGATTALSAAFVTLGAVVLSATARSRGAVRGTARARRPGFAAKPTGRTGASRFSWRPALAGIAGRF